MQVHETQIVKQLLTALVSIFLATLALGCSTLTTSAKLDVSTEPAGANVALINDSGAETVLGTTPLTLSDDILGRQDRVLRIQITKSGYVKEQIYIDTFAAKSRGKIQVRLTPMANWMEAYQDKNAQKYLEDVASMAAEMQSATVRGDFAKAERIGRSMVTRYPKLAAGWSLIGNVFYLQKRMADALDAYNKALALDPENQDTKGVVERIKTTGY